jgi:transposase
MSAAAPAASRLTCPRCGLDVRLRRRSDDVEYCPRCIAQSAGALSIALERRPRAGGSAPSGGPQELIARVARRVRARVSF